MLYSNKIYMVDFLLFFYKGDNLSEFFYTLILLQKGVFSKVKEFTPFAYTITYKSHLDSIVQAATDIHS